MPRRSRLNLVGAPQHIIQRGNNRGAAFFAEEDFRFYLDRLLEGSRKYQCAIYAYVLMTNHVHLLASSARSYGLSLMMQYVGRYFVRYINRTYRRSGNIEVQDLAAKDTADGFLMLASDRTAAYILDDVQLAGLIATAPKPDDFKILTQESLRQEPYGIMVRKDDAAFMAVVDKTVTELMTSGAIHEIYAKWFTRPIPPNNANLNFPMTDTVKELYKNRAGYIGQFESLVDLAVSERRLTAEDGAQLKNPAVRILPAF